MKGMARAKLFYVFFFHTKYEYKVRKNKINADLFLYIYLLISHTAKKLIHRLYRSYIFKEKVHYMFAHASPFLNDGPINL